MLTLARRRVTTYPGEWKDVARLVLDGRVADGPERAAFEQGFAELAGTRHAVAVESGRFAFELILRHAGLSPGDEIILPAYTLCVIPERVRKLGLVPVFADICPETFNLNAAGVQKRITSRTRAVVAVHLFGLPCDMDELGALCRERGLYLIEDAAHAAGAELRGKPVGGLGDAALFSLDVAKTISTFTGGVLTTDDDELAASVRAATEALPVRERGLAVKVGLTGLERFMGHPLPFTLFMSPLLRTRPLLEGMIKSYLAVKSSTRSQGPGRHTNLQAAVGLAQLERLGLRLDRLGWIADRYRERLAPSIVRQAQPDDRSTTNCYFVVQSQRVSAVSAARALLKRGVDVNAGDAILHHCGRMFSPEESFPVTDALHDHGVQLPLYPELSCRQVDRIIAAANEVLA